VAAAQTQAWEAHKADERAARARAEGRALSRLDGVAAGLPALVRAFKIQRRAARAGFDWKSLAPVLDKLDEERAELGDALKKDADSARIAEEMGDLLFACVNLARWLELEPEATLREATAKFERRFHEIEKAFAAEGRALEQASLDELEEAWQTAKARES
jgi:ATP diphosphatase